MALTTALRDAHNHTPGNPPKTPSKFDQYLGELKVPGCTTLEIWGTIKQGDILEKNGKTWTWCSYHKNTQYGYNGLHYSNHTGETHNVWRLDKSDFKKVARRKQVNYSKPLNLAGILSRSQRV